jgi:hypothetical protein
MDVVCNWSENKGLGQCYSRLQDMAKGKIICFKIANLLKPRMLYVLVIYSFSILISNGVGDECFERISIEFYTRKFTHKKQSTFSGEIFHYFQGNHLIIFIKVENIE